MMISPETANKKIVIIGAGHVGSHVALALAQAGLGEEIVLSDIVPGKAAAQALDLQDALTGFACPPILRAGESTEASSAALTVVCMGRSRRPGETRLDMLSDSLARMDQLLNLWQAAPPTGFVVTVTNPVDIVAEYLRQGLGRERFQVFGSGTLLDSRRLVCLLAAQSGLVTKDIYGPVLGEHGDSSMIPFSALRLAGQPLNAYPQLAAGPLLQSMRQRGMTIIEGKGSTEFGIGQAIADLARALLLGEERELCLSVALEGEYGICGQPGGVPCLVGAGGIKRLLELPLDAEEQTQLKASAAVIAEYCQRVSWPQRAK